MQKHVIGNISGLTPKYSVKDPNSNTELADPNATRALVALMNQHAVIGGAAAHWGGRCVCRNYECTLWYFF